MEVTGRLTRDAQVKTLKDDRKLVAFSIAINDYYKAKDGDKKEITTYLDCSYWISTNIAEWLKKATVVSLFGRVGLNAYTSMSGEAKASLTFHVNAIKIVAQPGKGAGTSEPVSETVKDDLPF